MKEPSRKEAALSDQILVYPTTWACVVAHDWTTIPPLDCPDAHAHFHANCEKCMYNPETCKDCAKDKCRRCHTSERVWGPTPDVVRERMREHWLTDHDPALVAEQLGVLF